MMNRAELMGHLGQDPTVRTLPSGDAVANFRMATDKTFLQNGQKVKKTEWHNIVAFGKIAQTVGKYLKKGRFVRVEGELRTRKWEGKDKVTHWVTEIICTNLRMLDRAPSAQPAMGMEMQGGDEYYDQLALMMGANADDKPPF